MHIEHFHFDQAQLRLQLLPILGGQVFHVTTAAGYEGIIEDGYIDSNVDGRCSSVNQSEVSYFRNNGDVCLIDLRSVTEEDLDLALEKFNFLNPGNSNVGFFLVLSSSAYSRLKPRPVRGEDGYSEQVVPFVEVGFPHSVSLNLITRVLRVAIEKAPDSPFLEALRKSQAGS